MPFGIALLLYFLEVTFKGELFQGGESFVTNKIRELKLPLTSQEKHLFFLLHKFYVAVLCCLLSKCFFRKTFSIAFINVLCLSEVNILTEVKVKAVRTHVSFLVKRNKHTVCLWLVMVPEHKQVAFLISLF